MCQSGFAGESCAVPTDVCQKPACTAPSKVTHQLEVFLPFYERDICSMRYLALSIKHHGGDVLGNVTLGWVSLHPLAKYQTSIRGIRHLFGARSVRLVDMHQLVHATDRLSSTLLANPSFNGSGWLAQQAAKLQVASIIRSRYYLVLDAKNALMRRVDFSTFFSPCGLPLAEDLGASAACSNAAVQR